MDDEPKVIVLLFVTLVLGIVAIVAINVLPFYWYGYCEQRIGDKTYTTKCLDD